MAKEICSGAIIMRGDKFLFGKRSKKKKWAPGKWDIVGGHALKNEEPLDTCKRETLEETGINVLDAELLLVTDMWDKNKEEYFSYYIYWITSWSGKAGNLTNEHSKLRWFTRQQLNDKSFAAPEYLMLIDKRMKQLNDK